MAALARAFGVLGLLAGLLSGGCAVGPAYHSPAPPSAATFAGAPLLAERRPASPAAAADRWWEGFGDPELTRLVRLALTQSLDLQAAQARLMEAAAHAKAARAELLPAGQANAQGEWEYASLNSQLGAIEHAFPGFDRYQKLYDLNLGASWEVDLFGGLRREAQAARASYQASAAAKAGVAIAVAAQATDAYVEVRAFQERLAVARAQLDTQRRLLTLVEDQTRRGVAAGLQLDQAQGALAHVAAQIPLLEAGLEAQLVRLEVVVGVTPGALHGELAAAASIPQAPALEATGGPAGLIRRRPDIVAAERTLAARDAGIGVAIADYYPKLSLSALAGFESAGLSNLVTEGSFQPQGLAGLRWRLFDFGRVDAEVAAARGARAEALADYRKSVLQAAADVESSIAALVRREAQARLLSDGEAALVKAKDASLAAYRNGHVSLIEVLDADARLLATRDERAQARAEAARAAVALIQALGGGWSA